MRSVKHGGRGAVKARPQTEPHWIIYLVGRGGIGKFTVAKELAQIAGCKVVDNHYWLNPIFGLIHQDGVTPLPAGIWPLTEQVRGAVLETIAAHSPPEWSFVFTHSASGNPEHETADQVICQDITEIADRRGARRLAVRLTCAPEELVRRVAMPERRLRFKGCDTEEVWLNARWQSFDPGWPRSMSIDTSGLPAQQTAEQILDRIRVLEAEPQ